MFTPEWVEFDGYKGIRLRRGGRFQFIHGSTETPPWERSDLDFKEMLVWWTPPDKPKQLLWCGPDGSWYNVYFSPVDSGS